MPAAGGEQNFQKTKTSIKSCNYASYQNWSNTHTWILLRLTIDSEYFSMANGKKIPIETRTTLYKDKAGKTW